MNKIRLFLIAIFILLFSTVASNAEIHLVEDGTRVNVFNSPDQTQLPILVGPGEPGDFEILICATRSVGSNSFLNATPGWTTLDSGSCGGSKGCILGIFTRTDDSPIESPNNCRWVDNTNMGGAGSFRYSGVDLNDFFINVSCNTGSGGIPTAPSILTSSNSGVVRVYTTGGINKPDILGAEQVQEGSFGFSASALGEFIVGDGRSFFFEDSGPTGEFEFQSEISSDWRACTIAFGPELNIGPIPTLSEWGLITMAGVFGIFGLLAIRRKKVAL